MLKRSTLASPLAIASAPWGLFLAALALGGCSQSYRPAPQAAAVPGAPAAPAWPVLPEGAACTAELNRYQAVLDADVGTGNLARSVYEKIGADMSRAAEACAAGKDSEARAIIRSTKLKHGYRAYL